VIMKKITFLFLVLLLSACSKAAPTATATLNPTPTATPVTPATLPPTVTLPQATATLEATATPKATLAPILVPTATQLAGEPTLAPSATFIPEPTTTPAPTDTPIVITTATPLPGLAAQGPYLVYLSTKPEGGQEITLLNPDGNGRKVLPLPENGYIPDVRNAVSPDGAWVTFYLGTPGQIDSGLLDASSGTYTLTLNLMRVSDGSTQQVASLLSLDYPANFLTAAEQAIQASPDLYKDFTPEQLANSMAQTFLGGLYTSGWSNNSLYLAFAAETDGPTSDLYLYTLSSKNLRRLSSELEQIQWLTWSSDNLRILYGTVNEYRAGSPLDNFRVVRIDGGGAQNIGQMGYRSGWATASVYTVYTTNEAGRFAGLANLNILTRRSTIIWAYSFLDYAFDLKNGTMAILGYSGEGPDQQTGVYLQAANYKFIPLNASNIFPRGSDDHRFVAASVDQGVVGIAQDGTITTIRNQAATISISPNWQWMVLFDAGHNGTIAGIELYDNKDQLVKQITPINPDRIVWRADSSGLFFRSGTELYYIAIPDGAPVLIDQNVAVGETGDFNNFVWVK
jgi:hypothetical protein